MPVTESRKKDRKLASVDIFKYLLTHSYSPIYEISDATGYNQATVNVVISGVLNPIIKGKADFRGEGKEKRYLSLYSIDPNKLSDIAVVTDILLHLDPQYMPERLKKSLDEYVAPRIKEQRRQWIKEQITKELKEAEKKCEELKTRSKQTIEKLRQTLKEYE